MDDLQYISPKKLRERLKVLDEISAKWSEQAGIRGMADAMDAIEQAQAIRDELALRARRYHMGVKTRQVIVL